MEIGEIIALNLKRIRKERNLSLGQLAEMASVSKVMLSQLEKGTSNPTVNTLWKIAGALQLPYTSLLELPDAKAIHVRKADIHALDEDKYHIFSYYAGHGDRKFELYQLELEPGCVHESIGHSTNSSEYLIVVDGCMILETNGERHTLEQDDGLCFEAAAPHIYRNISDRTAKAVMLISYG